MAEANYAKKSSIAGIIIACVCILVYLGAFISVIVRINDSMERRRFIAEQEFYDIADLAASAGLLSFMDETFAEIIQNALNEKNALEGLIISGAQGDYGFEREEGRALVWINNSPRFRSRFGFSRQPLFLPLRIQGQRNVNIQAVAGAFDYGELSRILREALFLIASALALAFLALFLESYRRNKSKATSASVEASKEEMQGKVRMPQQQAAAAFSEKPAQSTEREQKEAAKEHSNTVPQGKPLSGYSDRGRVVWEGNTELRLKEELSRCVEAEHDLCFIVMEFKPVIDDASYARFAADAARFFSSRNFVCEKGLQGISVICPALNLDAGFLNAGEFHTRIAGKYPNLFKSQTDLCIGLSARAGRVTDAKRLMFEAQEALERALMDPVSHIVAFKIDPEKYRAFMASKHAT
jgi:hypothetical protein